MFNNSERFYFYQSCIKYQNNQYLEAYENIGKAIPVQTKSNQENRQRCET